MHWDYDALVVGAGPAGSTFAAFLGRAGRRIGLLDAAVFPRDKPCGEGVMPSGIAVLAELGVLDDVKAAGAQPVEGIRYSLSSGESVRASFPAPPDGPGPGLAIRRTQLDCILFTRACSQAGVVSVPARRVTAIEREGDGWRVRTRSNETFTTRLLIGADGYRSTVRRLLGWQGRHTGRRYAIVGHFHLSPGRIAIMESDIHVVLQSGMERYYAAVGPEEALVTLVGRQGMMRALSGNLAGGYRRLVHADPVLAPRLLADDAQQEARVVACGPFDVRPSRVYGDGAMLIGDAAGFLDPATGEGIARSLRGARLAATIAGAALDNGSVAARSLAAYGQGVKILTRDTDRLTRLALARTSSPLMSRLMMRAVQRDKQLLPRLLGINAGAWGFSKLSPRDWLALLTGV